MLKWTAISFESGCPVVEIQTFSIRSEHQPADIFTKALGVERFKDLRGKFGVRDVHIPTLEGVLKLCYSAGTYPSFIIVYLIKKFSSFSRLVIFPSIYTFCCTSGFS